MIKNTLIYGITEQKDAEVTIGKEKTPLQNGSIMDASQQLFL